MDSIDQVTLNFSEANLFYLNLSLGFIMFGVAINLRGEDFIRVIRNTRSALVGMISQFLMLPALTFFLILIIQPRPSFALGMMLVAACPGGNISNFMTAMARGNTALSVSLTAVSSTLAIFMTPINLTFWAGMYSPTAEILTAVSLDFWQLLKTITTLLLIPIVLGMLLRKWKPKIADRLHPIMHYSSIVIFAAIVIMAFSANFDLFLSYIHLVILLVLAHNAVALLTGYNLGVLFNLEQQDRRSIAIETGIQNSGLGLILIFGFFDGLGGMAIVAAWWGIWHIISGLSLAYVWNNRPVINQSAESNIQTEV
ncbi:bile acid:sodium symporter family protein [Ekhidna sp. MALMAid0563]|uniref:bile acid:sodium symporter family protein n=1 Tax=Ekhidna sp. MALMAid0563 TaxID=3143937 RepID=UPI0032E007A5